VTDKPLKTYTLTVAEKKMYSGYTLRAVGTVSHREGYISQLLVEFTSGPFDGECKWFTEAELKELSVEVS
jgi:hypothetical protein